MSRGALASTTSGSILVGGRKDPTAAVLAALYGTVSPPSLSGHSLRCETDVQRVTFTGGQSSAGGWELLRRSATLSPASVTASEPK